jgi:signal transduction histidine kinase
MPSRSALGLLVSRLERVFVPPHLRGDPVASRTASLVVGFSLTPILFVPVLAVMEWLAFPAEIADHAVWLVLASAPVCASVPFVLRATGSTLIAGNLMVAYGFFLFGVFSYYAGGALSPPSFWNVLLPMTALALVGRRGAAFWTGAVLLEALAVAWLEQNGLVLQNYVLPEWRALYWFMSTACLATLIVLAGLVYERTKNATIQHLGSANSELARARDAAERASRAKSDFLAVLTHEIRTPMTAILGFTEVLREEWSEARVPERSLATLATIQRSGRELLDTVNDLLDLSKLEAGKLELERIAFGPAEHVAEVLEPLRARAAERGLVLELELVPPLPGAVVGDPGRLRQVLENLVQNALAFTERGSIRVSLGVERSPRGDCLDLRVTDTGVGIAPDRLARIFEPALAEAGAPPGKRVGLGLAMARRLTELMDGTIEATSEVGAGSTFRVRVPLRSPEIAAVHPMPPTLQERALPRAGRARSRASPPRSPRSTSC